MKEHAMWRVSILSSQHRGQAATEGGDFSCKAFARPLPVFYMSDYSVLGLKVDRLGESIGIVEGGGFPVEKTEWGPEIVVQEPGQVVSILDLLAARGVSAEIADLIDGVYQG